MKKFVISLMFIYRFTGALPIFCRPSQALTVLRERVAKVNTFSVKKAPGEMFCPSTVLIVPAAT